MVVQIRKLEAPYNYAQIAEVLRNTYFQEYGQAGALQWNEKYAKFYFDGIVLKADSRDFIFGAYEGNQLIGTTFGHRDAVMFENRLRLEMVNLGLTAVVPEYKRQGIAQELISHVIEHAKEKNLDFVMAFPEKGRFGDKVLEKLEFKNFGKTQHFIKLMEDRGLEVLRDYLGYNVVMVKLASLYSHLPELMDLVGTTRYGKIEEIDKVTGIINSYASRVPLANIYTQEGYTNSNIRFAQMNEIFGDPWGFHWLVLEGQNGEILATLSYRIEIVTFEPEPSKYMDGPVALLTSLAFHEKMELDQKMQFVNAILHKIRKEHPEVYVVQITSPQHELDVFDKLKFVDDRTNYYLYIKSFTEKGEEINKYKKFKEYFLQYYR